MNDVLERPAVKTATKQVQLVIEGRVQGVGFRAWTKAQARKLGLNGFVRNRMDGTVEAHFSGPQEIVVDMIARCHEGPMVARVTKVTQRPSQHTFASGFELKDTL